MVRVFINGYGNIGRRLASAFAADKGIQLVGVAKYSADEKVKEALENHYDVYVPKEAIGAFKEKGYKVMGSVEDAVERCDFVVDAAKEGAGYDNKTNYYEPMNKPAIFQGGEDRNGERSVADMIHNSRVNYDKAIGKTYVIQGSLQRVRHGQDHATTNPEVWQ